MNDTSREPDPTTTPVAILGSVVTIANVLVTIIIVVLMIRDKQSAITAALAAVGFFTASTVFSLLTLSGTLTAIVTNGQNQETLRRGHKLQYTVANTIELPKQEVYTLPAEPLPLPAPMETSVTFVTPRVDDSVRREALAWALQLYGQDGNPDPSKVLMKSDRERPGRIRIAAPSRPAKELLVARKVLVSIGTGYKLNLSRCPTASLARNHLETG